MMAWLWWVNGAVWAGISKHEYSRVMNTDPAVYLVISQGILQPDVRSLYPFWNPLAKITAISEPLCSNFGLPWQWSGTNTAIPSTTPLAPGGTITDCINQALLVCVGAFLCQWMTYLNLKRAETRNQQTFLSLTDCVFAVWTHTHL